MKMPCLYMELNRLIDLVIQNGQFWIWFEWTSTLKATFSAYMYYSPICKTFRFSPKFVVWSINLMLFQAVHWRKSNEKCYPPNLDEEIEISGKRTAGLHSLTLKSVQCIRCRKSIKLFLMRRRAIAVTGQWNGDVQVGCLLFSVDLLNGGYDTGWPYAMNKKWGQGPPKCRTP